MTGMCNASVHAKRRNCGSSTVSSTSAHEYCRTCTTNVDHLVNELHLENLHDFLNRGTKRICMCATTEMSTTLTHELCTTLHNYGHVKNRSKSSTWRISTVICTVCTVGTRLCSITRMSNHCRRTESGAPSKQSTAGTCRCMTTGTEEDLQEDAARPAPTPTPVPTTTATTRPPPLSPAAS